MFRDRRIFNVPTGPAPPQICVPRWFVRLRKLPETKITAVSFCDRLVNPRYGILGLKSGAPRKFSVVGKFRYIEIDPVAGDRVCEPLFHKYPNLPHHVGNKTCCASVLRDRFYVKNPHVASVLAVKGGGER